MNLGWNKLFGVDYAKVREQLELIKVKVYNNANIVLHDIKMKGTMKMRNMEYVYVTYHSMVSRTNIYIDLQYLYINI